MVVFGESEMSEILDNCNPRDLRSYVIILTRDDKLGGVFKKLFVIPRKSGFDEL
jgi:hypothetical protein